MVYHQKCKPIVGECNEKRPRKRGSRPTGRIAPLHFRHGMRTVWHNPSKPENDPSPTLAARLRCPYINNRLLTRPAFTLIELLVALGIIALLLAILLPTIARVRAQGKRTVCLAHLRDLGNMMQLYLHDNHERVMRVNPIPSDSNLLPYAAPSIVTVLQPYHCGQVAIFDCPADSLIRGAATAADPGADTYFQREGTSYEYNVFFNAYAVDPDTGVNRVWVDALADAKRRPPLKLEPSFLPLLVDFESFHGKSEKPQSRNALYADFHAAQLEIPVPKAP